MTVSMGIVCTLFTGMVLYNMNSPGVELLAIFPVLAFIGTVMWGKGWYQYEYKPAMKKRGQTKIDR